VPDQALAPDEASKGVFLTPLDAATAIGRAEGSGTEVHDTTNPRAVMHSTNGSYTEVPNKTHPSSMSPLTVPALASISPTTTTAGAGTIAVTPDRNDLHAADQGHGGRRRDRLDLRVGDFDYRQRAESVRWRERATSASALLMFRCLRRAR
jgi:hypothetical protein